MLDSRLRDTYQKCFVSFFVTHLPSNIKPNLVTILAAIIGVMVAACLYWNLSLLAICCLLISGYLDTLDGSIARHQKTSSPKGALLDIYCDRLVEFSVIFGLYLVSPSTRSTIALLMLGSILLCITSFLTVGVFSENTSEKSFYYSPGIMERTEAFILFILMILMPRYFSLFGSIFIILVLWTSLYRVYEFINNN